MGPGLLPRRYQWMPTADFDLVDTEDTRTSCEGFADASEQVHALAGSGYRERSMKL